jgi:hypothetical protein
MYGSGGDKLYHFVDQESGGCELHPGKTPRCQLDKFLGVKLKPSMLRYFVIKCCPCAFFKLSTKPYRYTAGVDV